MVERKSFQEKEYRNIERWESSRNNEWLKKNTHSKSAPKYLRKESSHQQDLVEVIEKPFPHIITLSFQLTPRLLQYFSTKRSTVSHKFPYLTIYPYGSVKKLLTSPKNSLPSAVQNQFRRVIEQHSHGIIAQLITQSVFVAVVHPFAHPEHWGGRWVFRLVWIKD